MKRLSALRRAAVRLLMAAFPAVSLSCGSIFDGEGDCRSLWQVRFIYDKNMDFVDVFSENVESVRLTICDAATGRVVAEQRESGNALATGHYVMPVNLPPGDYDFVAWCGLEGNDRFAVAEVDSATVREDLSCRLVADREREDAPPCCAASLKHLFHGCTSYRIHDRAGLYTIPIYLTRNTNRLRIELFHAGADLTPERYSVSLADGNGRMEWDNSILPGQEKVVYLPYAVSTDSVAVRSGEAPFRQALFVELSTGRLLADHSLDARFTITDRQSGDTLFSLPLIEYLIMAKDRELPMDEQEYLDREYDYEVELSLADRPQGGWYCWQLKINDWHVIYNPDVDL